MITVQLGTLKQNQGTKYPNWVAGCSWRRIKKQKNNNNKKKMYIFTSKDFKCVDALRIGI